VIELPEERQVLDDRLFELLQEAVPPDPRVHTATTATAGLDAETIRAAIDQMRNQVSTLPTWVVPVGTYVDSTIPVNVVHSALVDAGYFIHIPADAFDPHPFDA
jgi:hypothetical protein